MIIVILMMLIQVEGPGKEMLTAMAPIGKFATLAACEKVRKEMLEVDKEVKLGCLQVVPPETKEV